MSWRSIKSGKEQRNPWRGFNKQSVQEDCKIDERKLNTVEVPVDCGRDRLDLGAELLLDAVEVLHVVLGDHVDREPEVPEAAAAADAVQVRLGRTRKIKVDDHVDRWNVNAARKEVRGDEVPRAGVAELVKDAIAIGLVQLSVDVEAAVAELRDALGEKLDARHAVAEAVRYEREKRKAKCEH